MISTAIHGPHQDAAPYSTNQRQPKDHGAPGALTPGTLAPPSTITGATNPTFPRHAPTASQHPLNSSPPTATSPQNHHMKLRPALQLNLIELCQHRRAKDPGQLSRHQRAVKIINDIYQLNLQQSPRVDIPAAPPPRVEPTLSSNPTATRTLQQAPRLHNRITRRNTPGLSTSPTPWLQITVFVTVTKTSKILLSQ